MNEEVENHEKDHDHDHDHGDSHVHGHGHVCHHGPLGEHNEQTDAICLDGVGFAYGALEAMFKSLSNSFIGILKKSVLFGRIVLLSDIASDRNATEGSRLRYAAPSRVVNMRLGNNLCRSSVGSAGQ